MLQDVRKSMQGTTAKVIVWAIAITFALFGVESIVGGINGEPEVAEVNGDGIPESEFKIAVERRKRQLLAQMGADADPDMIDEGRLSKAILDGMITQKILEQDAEGKGLYVSVPMIDEYIRSMPEFQVDGKFSDDRLQSLLGMNGFTLQAFRSSLKNQFLVGQGRTALVGSAFVLETERDELLMIDRQARSFGYATLKQKDYLNSVDVDDAEVQSYFESNRASFVKPESVDISFLVIDRETLGAQLEVSSDEVEARYQQELADFVATEERNAAHILVAISSDVTEEEALKEVTNLKSRIEAGESFSDLAKAESDDEGSAGEGGELGLSGRGVFVSAFEDALFSLSKGEVSEPVKTEFGYHLIKLLDVQANEPPSLAERAVAIEADLKLEKAGLRYVELTQQLADITYSSPDLKDASDELGLELREKIGVSKESKDPLFSNPKLQRALFKEENLTGEHNSEVIEIDENKSLVFKVEQYQPETQRELAEVSAQILDTLKAKKATEYAESLGNAFVVRVEAGEDPKLVASDMGFEWVEKNEVKRDDFSVDPRLLFKIFAMQKPSDAQLTVSGFEITGGDFAVAALAKVSNGDVADISILEKQSISSTLGQSLGEADYGAYLESLDDSAEVEKL